MIRYLKEDYYLYFSYVKIQKDNNNENKVFKHQQNQKKNILPSLTFVTHQNKILNNINILHPKIHIFDYNAYL